MKNYLLYFVVFGLFTLPLKAQPLVPDRENQAVKFELGIASYAFRQQPFEEVMRVAEKLDLNKVAVKSVHIPFDIDEETLQKTKNAAREAGVDIYAGGVIYMKTEDEVRQAFTYADRVGMKMIVGVPNPELIDLCQDMVQQFNIQLAIHNHGSRNILYPDAGSAYDLIKSRDPRMGLCIDVGHTLRLNLNPASEIRKYQDRLLDIQLWDVSSASHEGRSILPGYGVMDLQEVLQALVDVDYTGVVSVEYWNDPENPELGTAYTIGYLRAMMTKLDFPENVFDNELTDWEEEGGWQLLFNGKDSKGWRGINLEQFPQRGWYIQQGNLCVDQNQGQESANGGDIVTLKEYDNFILEWEWKMMTPGGNSGLKYFVQEGRSDNKKYGYGIEYQLLDDANHPWMLEGKMETGDYRTVAAAYELYPAQNKKLKPLGTYNHSKIEVNNGQVTHWLNGIKVLEFDRFSDDFKQKVKESKFSSIEDFGHWESGHILLQDHGSNVCFKNIKIKEL